MLLHHSLPCSVRLSIVVLPNREKLLVPAKRLIDLLNRFAAGCTIPSTRPASCRRASGKWGRAESQATAPMTTRLLHLREMDHVLLRSIRNVQCQLV